MHKHDSTVGTKGDRTTLDEFPKYLSIKLKHDNLKIECLGRTQRGGDFCDELSQRQLGNATKSNLKQMLPFL